MGDTQHADHSELAATAMRHWVFGAASGDWSRLVALLDEDVVFHVPVPGFDGARHGIGEAKRFFDHLAAVLRAELEVTSTLRDHDRIGYEVAVRGVMDGRRFVQALCLIFVLGDGRVRQFAEYVAWPGGLEPHVEAPKAVRCGSSSGPDRVTPAEEVQAPWAQGP